ncbi:hypothetical protein SERLA73DRAFT_164710 [Serpula lacrymans var. lacrymans S7.3]|uniref:Protein byr4 n=1 Tax=Serpula lacrymans var. lacrymans (strain S7.3) TaxID=936435 RepID=F8PIB9_SERL3|nr:hypothetical protein SERLA73DRAFT_164710 [Serpula lacrymans var. lacrymans S7.3]
MNTIPAPTLVLTREEWPDADFDIPDGEPLNPLTAESDKEDDDDDMDWDAEMDLGKTGGAKAKAVVAGMVARSESFRRSSSNMIIIRPPLASQEEEGDDEDDEGVSTIKVAALPKTFAKPLPTPIEEDIESAFLLPTDLTQLSLAPLSLNHRSSKNSLEWGDKDQTSSSQSSDAYSTLGFADASPSSNSASSISSLPETEESEGDEDEGDLEGLVIPSGLFESGQGGKHLKKILELKKKTQIIDQRIKVASPDPEDDFEMGLVIDDDVDLSPSRLLTSQQTQRLVNRSKSMPARPPVTTRPPSRAKGSRAKSPINPPPSSVRQFQRLKLSPSPPLQPILPVRAQTYKEALSNTPPPSSMSFLQPKPGSLRGQKSHSGLKPPTPPSTQRKQLTRKASLSSLLETSTSGASGSGAGSTAGSSAKLARYEAPTAASRAKSHTNSTSRIHGLDFIVPPTRPSTPSSNPAALRLTMPTSMRMKSRPALSAVFAAPPSPAVASMAVPSSSHRATSPLPPRPPSTSSLRTRTVRTPPVASSSSAPKLLRRPKRPRTYGDGTELDGIDDLPTDREKEGRFRVQPKSTSRLPAPGNPSKSFDKDKERGTVRKRGRREVSNGSDVPNALTPTTNMLRRTGRIEFPSKFSGAEINVKKKKDTSSPVSGQTKRKPTLIRHLGGANGPKVVGDMKWNPITLRWEGNDQVLRDFDAAVGTSTRPALITHLTGSSIGSPVGSFAAGARKVGNMIFDPARMCWISTLPPDQEEPDVFADLADDEEEDWETKGGTIRASQQLGGTSISGTVSDTSASSSTGVVEAPSPARSHTRTISESGSDCGDRGSRASLVCDVDGDFVEKCRAAEQRHRVEMKGWRMTMSSQADPFAEPDRSSLFEIRALATRKY